MSPPPLWRMSCRNIQYKQKSCCPVNDFQLVKAFIGQQFVRVLSEFYQSSV